MVGIGRVVVVNGSLRTPGVRPAPAKKVLEAGLGDGFAAVRSEDDEGRDVAARTNVARETRGSAHANASTAEPTTLVVPVDCDLQSFASVRAPLK